MLVMSLTVHNCVSKSKRLSFFMRRESKEACVFNDLVLINVQNILLKEEAASGAEITAALLRCLLYY